MNMRPFTGRCHTCGHDHDADVTTLRDVLDITDKARDAEIAALRAEIHLLRILEKSLPVCQKENDGLRAAATSLVEQNDSLRAEVERLRKRHHWMINRVLACDYGDNDATGKQVGWRIVADLRNGDAFMYGESTDAAIDAAMRQEPKA